MPDRDTDRGNTVAPSPRRAFTFPPEKQTSQKNFWDDDRKKQPPSAATIEAMAAAIGALLRDVLAGDPRLLALASYRHSNRTTPPAVSNVRLKTLTIYVLTAELYIPPAAVARALGVGRAAATLARTRTLALMKTEPRLCDVFDQVMARLGQRRRNGHA